jgi:hypothetical protein
LADDVARWRRPALWRRRSHDLRSAISRTRHQKDFGEGPAIENVHYFGFVLPIYFLRSLAGWRARRRRTAILPPMWWVRLAEVGGIARPAPVHARPEMFFGSAAPLKTFIILASFCQIYYPADRCCVMDACRGTIARAGYSLFWLRSARSERSVLSRPAADVVR